MMLPAVFLALAAASSEEPEQTPSEELWERLHAEYPEPILEEVLGFTGTIQKELGTVRTNEFVHKMLNDGLTERCIEWRISCQPDNLQFWYDIACDPITPQEILVELAMDYDGYIRVGASRNPYTPPDLLRKLAQDLTQEFSSVIRRRVAGNPSTPIDVLQALAKDSDVRISDIAIANLRVYGLQP